jgi:hypothetical protein
MPIRLYILLSVLIGIVCGFISSHTNLGWLNLIVWVLVGLAIIYVSSTRRDALYAGSLFGFITIASWLFTGFQGAPDKFIGFAVLSLGLSILGAACGSVGALVFYRLFRHHH